MAAITGSGEISLDDIIREKVIHGKPYAIFEIVNSIIVNKSGIAQQPCKSLKKKMKINTTKLDIKESNIISNIEIKNIFSVSSRVKNGSLIQNRKLK